jgi:hypothetical protein
MAGHQFKLDTDLIFSGNSILFKTHSDGTGLTEPTSTTQFTLSTTAATFVQPVGIPNGTVALPGLAFAADLDTGIYRIGANNLGIAVAGAVVADLRTVGAYITGNVNLGAVGAAGTTEPVSAAMFKAGTRSCGKSSPTAP